MTQSEMANVIVSQAIEIAALQRQCADLTRERDELLQQVPDVASAPQCKKSETSFLHGKVKDFVSPDKVKDFVSPSEIKTNSDREEKCWPGPVSHHSRVSMSMNDYMKEYAVLKCAVFDCSNIISHGANTCDVCLNKIAR